MFWLLAACTTEDPELVGLAAASLADVLPEVAAAWEAGGGAPIVFSFDASSKLARQVEAGVDADLVVFADVETTDAIAPLLAPDTRREVAGNTLVVVVPADAARAPAGPADLAGLAHVAVASEAVPAGRYARVALAAEWEHLAPKVVTGDHVRTTLAWVARGEADAGVVYATDARAEPRVRVAFAFPPGAHPPITYPAAVLAGSDQPREAEAFLGFVASAEGQAIFRRHGFGPPP